MGDQWRDRILDAVSPLNDGARNLRVNHFNPGKGDHPRPTRTAAVLVPVLDLDEPEILLTRRAAHLSQHAGQVSFPGGRVDPTDLSPADAAVRELHEEVGIDPGYVDMIGRFDSYETVTGYEVQPFVGIVRPGYRLSIDPNEVALTFEAPVDFRAALSLNGVMMLGLGMFSSSLIAICMASFGA